ncbi:helix-turn-helix domain-containing protein [Nocardia terpenica]|uniref:helix-turn-helix transcriptional regulator n=1 Tax=Nocardia terpenica TaxID=455432 RepID=UPI001895CF4D|nr:helix-turn-helix domain-containing protein [Nocardia terpenica]MBF6061399.1 helix-turn-helix domain-containing protein [Nocardia terpenica]MBF6105372.1 helix-turn-helix domain-containing protein [Nocardia terpenica]MBF6113158.1 helix-turn-helix domain-containing protein [Nocardia terpenica]MBF6119288.1 helix-turn-helix domain-containing protein [Nocardia terpenica]MBF6152936.1 helix-turn-helix domain-containing protein [Nocardia terpenica]
MDGDRYLQATDCEEMTGIPAATWRYWAHKHTGPDSFKIGRRRLYRESVVRAWLAEQENLSARGKTV